MPTQWNPRRNSAKRFRWGEESLTDYLRICGLGQKIVHVDGLDEVLHELKAQGRNLNRLTIMANIHKIKILRGDVDTDHLHSHLIVNSVSCVTGRKLHQNAAGLQRQRQISDEICAAHGLTVLEPPQKNAQDKKMRPGEYRSAARGESWKFRLINTIDLCMRTARTRAEFFREKERRGYQVRWETSRKYITS